MKVSAKQKAKVRKAILKAAVDIMIKKSFEKATMREIAKKAKIADATIYGYFPSKERILFGYFESAQEQTFESLDSIPGFEKYSLQEKIQTLIESELEQFLPDREFVILASKLIYRSPLAGFEYFSVLRKSFSEKINEFLTEEVEAGRIPEQVFHTFICALFWDYYTLILMYWINDDSEMFHNTSQLIDLSLKIIISLIENDVLTRTADLSAFILKTHFLRFTKSTDLFDSLKQFKDEFIEKDAPKRKASNKQMGKNKRGR